MTHRGQPNGITYNGMSRKGFKTMSLAGVERGFEIIVQLASFRCLAKPLSDITTQITVGQISTHIGNGYNKDFMKQGIVSRIWT